VAASTANGVFLRWLMTDARDDLFVDDVSDDALEECGRCDRGVANYTVVFCTALDLCPGP